MWTRTAARSSPTRPFRPDTERAWFSSGICRVIQNTRIECIGYGQRRSFYSFLVSVHFRNVFRNGLGICDETECENDIILLFFLLFVREFIFYCKRFLLCFSDAKTTNLVNGVFKRRKKKVVLRRIITIPRFQYETRAFCIRVFTKWLL